MNFFTNVYISKISDNSGFDEVYPFEREQYIHSSANEKLRKQRYWVWKTLEKAILSSYGKKIDEIRFSHADGKWTCDEFYFSLSHTDGVVAVAISNNRCGIDIENFSKRTEKNKDFMPLAKRICTENEISDINSFNDLISLWTKKESIYKTLNLPNVNIFEIECSEYFCETYQINLEDDYIVSVCCEKSDDIKINII